ncbi:sigma-70 family RNA polymerase sigma factor [Streptomyces sp. NPDC048297]|uniref:sigma-70 family RNA polymerase sigma factor n=1 Tax=Streptomyces sp. NPDC048297 TaxID=3365531 RepID=UPI00372038DD
MSKVEEFEDLRPLLFSIAYRVLGSVSEAEDAVQETWLRFDRSSTRPTSTKAFLSTTVTRISIDVLRLARVRREEYVGPWFPEPLLSDPYQDPARAVELADSVSMAALLLLERLSPLERAVFVLREVFAFGFDDVAAVVGRSEAACRQLLVRARRHMEAKETGSGGSATGGGADTSASGGGSGGSGGVTSACTTKNTQIQFIQSAHHASEQQAATGAIRVTNTSKATCTIVGAVTLTAKDDQGKADPVETDNSESGTDAVDIEPGATAQAWVAYTDLNFDGSPSGREVCAVQASKVEIALPKDMARTVRVTKDGGAPGSFDVCGNDVRVDAFEAAS